MDEAERLADHVVIVDRGRVVAAGAPAELAADGRSLEDVFLSVTGTGTGARVGRMTAPTFAPGGGAAPLRRMLAAQSRMEVGLLARNGEQLLLTIVIPTVVLVLFATAPVADLPSPRVDFLVPGVLALAVMSTAFTGQAIATGFERRYGVLRRLGTTPMPRWVLLAAKTAAVAVVEVAQVALLAAVGLALGWSPHGSPLAVAGLLLLGTLAFSALGLLLAGVLRAEATLAAANLVYLLLLVLGGVVFPLSDFSPGVRHALELLPISALTDGLRTVLRHGADAPLHDWVTLLVLVRRRGSARGPHVPLELTPRIGSTCAPRPSPHAPSGCSPSAPRSRWG